MLDLKLVQNSPEVVAQALKNRNSDISVADFTALDERRRAALSKLEALQSERNKASGEVARIKREGGNADALLARLAEVSDQVKALNGEAEELKSAVQDWMLNTPNVPDASVPVGASEEDNQEVHVWGEVPKFSFKPLEHWELGANLHGLDFERAGKLSGARFAVYWDWAARLERAIINFFLDVQTRENGYTEIQPPLMVNRKTMTGTGNLPKFEADLFKVPREDADPLYLIPTAEVPVTNIVRDEILAQGDLPLKLVCHTPCFRSEAGSYGKDTRGMIRQHQFDKVELVQVVAAEKSNEAHEELTRHAEIILEKLDLPYRRVVLCTGDMGFSSARTYDLEVWLPGQNAYREISSCSNFEAFQARRMQARCRNEKNKTELVHTLNGSGLAVGRTLVAILENYQNADGSITVPVALRPYMGGAEKIIAS